MGQRLKVWGKQNTKCIRCKKPSVKTFETAYDDSVSTSYCIRYFERLCAVCSYWAAWILVDNGRIKISTEKEYIK